MRRSWLGGLTEVAKRYVLAAAAHNLGRLLWKLLGIGKPRSLQGCGRFWAAFGAIVSILLRILTPNLDQADQTNYRKHQRVCFAP